MKKNKKSRKRIMVLVIVIAAAALCVFGYLRLRANQAETAKTTYEIVDVTKGTIEVKVKGAGTVEPLEDETIYASAAGTVKDVLLENGDTVKKGDVIAVLESDALESQKTSLKQQIDETDMSILTARSVSGGKNVTAPVKGTVKAVYAKEGDSVDAVVERDGALALICPDGLMKTEVACEGALKTGDAVKVTVGAASADGVVISVSGGKAVVQFEDDGFAVGADATVTDANGTAAGSGVVAVKNPVYVSVKGGTVEDVRVEAGDDVSRGGKLMTLEGDILSSSLYSLLEQRDSLQNDLNNVLADIDGLTIRAGRDGVISGLTLKEGQAVAQGAALLTIENTDAVKIDVEIDELDIANIETGDEATVTFDALPDKTFSAAIMKINPVGQSQNNVTKYTVTLTLDHADGVMLGMSADVQIVSERAQDVLIIPIEAIQTINGEKFVAFEGEVNKEQNDVTATHKVVTGITDGVNIEVKEKSLQERMWSANGMNGGKGVTAAASSAQ